jgi:hypothetical protein
MLGVVGLILKKVAVGTGFECIWSISRRLSVSVKFLRKPLHLGIRKVEKCKALFTVREKTIYM